MTKSLVKVAVDAPLVGVFDYLAPPDIQAGCFVEVSFGRRQLIGMVVEVDVSPTTQSVEKIKSITTVCTAIPPVSQKWLDFCGVVARYYLRGMGEMMLPAVPAGIRNVKRWQYFAEQAAQGWPKLAQAEKSVVTVPGPSLLAGQKQALDVLKENFLQGGYAPFLLYGVTGSGKTEVYLQFIAAVLARDTYSQILFLLPEINLTPQFEKELQERFPGQVIALLHSGIADGRRVKTWLSAHLGRARIILGTRLAVLASIPYLAAIIVDEEHDISYKQQEGLRYSARDLAVWRAYQLKIPVILGSATPALETWQHSEVANSRYQRLELNERAQSSAVLPQVQIIDLAQEVKQGRSLYQGIAQPLLTAIAKRLEQGEQSLLYINRRGYAPVLSCDACGWLSGCQRCSTYMVLHREAHGACLRCHHCSAEMRVPRYCPNCGNVDLLPLGRGTQRIEEALLQKFPQARIARIDADSTRRKGQIETLLNAVHMGEVDILVGTQMIAKGHDFQKVTLVGIVNPDSALHSHDFRASERLFAQLMQVSGRAGRADLPGEVLLQTYYPQAKIFKSLLSHDYPGYAAYLLKQRRAASLPPFFFQALVSVEASDLSKCFVFLKDVREQVMHCSECIEGVVVVFDPIPRPIAKLAGKEYAQMLIESGSRPALQHVLEKLVEILKVTRPTRRWQIERDPVLV